MESNIELPKTKWDTDHWFAALRLEVLTAVIDAPPHCPYVSIDDRFLAAVYQYELSATPDDYVNDLHGLIHGYGDLMALCFKGLQCMGPGPHSKYIEEIKVVVDAAVEQEEE